MNTCCWEDIAVGMKHEYEASFTEEIVAAFAGISGDENPLHLDREYAAAAGFRAPMLFGMLTSTLYSQLVGVYLPGKYALLQGIDIDFHNPCFAGEWLRVQGEIAYINDAYKRMEIKASIRNDNRKLVSKATIRVGFAWLK
jgi:3-hydroxybutyryl-CoA dehydratase